MEAGLKRKLHFGYLVVVALVLTSFIPLSLALSCAGIFYPPLSEALRVEKGVLSYYISVLWLAALVALPFMGRLLDGRDARACLTVAVGIAVAAFVWLSFTRALWQFYVAAAAMGVSVGMLLFLAPSTLINRWFAKRAGVMLGICMTFTGVGGMVWSTVGGLLIGSIGWSATYLVFAALSALCLPVTLFMVSSRPSDKGLRPVGWEPGDEAQEVALAAQAAPAAQGASASQGVSAPQAALAAQGAPSPQGVPAAQAFRMPVFYLILAMCFTLNIAMAVYFMIPSYATTLEIGAAMPLLGATASSVAMAGQTASKLVLGAVGEKVPHASTLVALACGIAGSALFAFLAVGVPAFYAAALLFGVYYGVTNVMMPLFTRRAFGDAEYAQIYSRVSMVASISNVIGAFVWGTVVSLTGSYIVMFCGAIALMAVTCAVVVAIGRTRRA